MVVLAFLMPIVASMGGNAGMQTLAVTVRTLATNDLTKNNFTQNIFKEFNIGILNGIIFAMISAFVVQVWFDDSMLSIIISISMILDGGPGRSDIRSALGARRAHFLRSSLLARTYFY